MLSLTLSGLILSRGYFEKTNFCLEITTLNLVFTSSSLPVSLHFARYFLNLLHLAYDSFLSIELQEFSASIIFCHGLCNILQLIVNLVILRLKLQSIVPNYSCTLYIGRSLNIVVTVKVLLIVMLDKKT